MSGKTNNRARKLMHSHYSHATFPQADCSALFFDKGIEEKWLSTVEAAKFLKITPNALRILVCRGKVKFFKFGNRLRFRKQDLTALLFNKGECA